MTRKVFLLLGSNLGDRASILKLAAQKITEKLGKEVKRSNLYETAAWGKEDQPSFLNQVIEIETSLTPHALLKNIAKIEEDLGRVRYERWGQRLIDIDILYYNSSVVVTSNLEIPHSEIPNRRFTLAPMTEIAPDFIHPMLGKTQQQLLDECTDPLEVTVL